MRNHAKNSETINKSRIFQVKLQARTRLQSEMPPKRYTAMMRLLKVNFYDFGNCRDLTQRQLLVELFLML